MNHRKSSLGNSRDFGMSTNGKGSADRTTNRENFINNLVEVKFDGVTGLRKIGNRLVKVYGKPARPTPPRDTFAETDGEWPVLKGRIVNDIPITTDIYRE